MLSQQTGHWLSQDRRHQHKFLNTTVEHVDKNPKELEPVLKEFQQAVEDDPRLRMLFTLMFEQVSFADQVLSYQADEPRCLMRSLT